ncbi:MAG: serine hydrolase [Eubacterium sp.]|nr:serine hydrolase [Eubacterium sp.]
MNFEAFKEDIVKNNWNVHGVEIYEDGKLIYRFGDTCDTKYPIYSATKSILSVAVGIAEDRSLIDLDKSVLDYITVGFVDEMTSDMKEKFEKISLRRLMTMSVPGFPFRPEGDSYLRFSLSWPDIKEDEIRFDYSNIHAYLVGVALSSAVGDVWEFIDSDIMSPLGISGVEYTRCPDGYFYGASGMSLSVNDLSRIGLLLYNRGQYEGRQIVSKRYVDKATSNLQMNREGGYGYFIWKYHDGFSINGKWKQRCYVLPDRKLMITFLSDIKGDSEDLCESMEKNIIFEA